MNSPLVKLDGIDRIYGSDGTSLQVLHEICLNVEKGEFIGIVGSSGSGKTTLMNILGCLDRPSNGSYFLNGHDMSTLGDNRLSEIRNKEIGFVFQSFNLIPELTVLENTEVPLFYLKMPKGKRKARCLELLDAVGLSERLSHYPNQLSGGECQRMAIARSLVNDPAILLADEPTGNLDSRNGREILKLFHGMHAEGRTIIMVTHNMEIASGLPRVVELRDGRVVSDRMQDAAAGRGG